MEKNNGTTANKIGFIVTSVAWGGLEMNVLKLARLLAEKNWDVHFFLLKDSRLANESKSTIKNVHFIDQHKKYFDIKGAFRFSNLLKSKNIDKILVFHNFDLDFIYFTKLFSSNKLKVIYQQQMQIGIRKKDLIHKLRYSAIDFWISPLHLLRDEVVEKTPLNPDKIKIIPLGTDISRFIKPKYSKNEARDKFQLGHNGFIMGIIGRIDPLKGQLFLIKSVHKLREKHPELELLIVGEPTIGEETSLAYQKELKDYVAHHNLGEVIHFRNFTNDVNMFYNAVDLFALATKGETFGMVTVEAMLSGVPIIATNSAGTPEILGFGEFGQLYVPNDQHDFCKKIDYILANPGQIKEMAVNAKNTAINLYSQDIECSKIEELIRT